MEPSVAVLSAWSLPDSCRVVVLLKPRSPLGLSSLQGPESDLQAHACRFAYSFLLLQCFVVIEPARSAQLKAKDLG